MTHSLWSRLDDAAPWNPGSDDALVRERVVVELFGLPFELCWIPERAAREDIPTDERPAFAPGRGVRIRREEAFWEHAGVVATPNRFPFYWRQLLLWPSQGTPREADADFLRRCFEIAEATGASLLVNSIGASASIPLAHAHLVERRLPMLEALPLAVVHKAPGLRLRVTNPSAGVPILVVVVEAEDAATRAQWTRRLLDTRRTAAFNLLAHGHRAWIVPRRAEVPSIGFPFAVGAGELSGRFVYPDQPRLLAARAASLEAALAEATVPFDERQVLSLRRSVEDWA